MKIIILNVVICLLGSIAYSNDNSTIQTDMKFLCAIKKMEVSLGKDKNIDAADLVERMSSIKDSGLRDKTSKDALKAISTMPAKEQSKAWKQFAKDNKIKGISCL